MNKTNKTQTKQPAYFVATKYKNKKMRISLYTKDWKSVSKSDVGAVSGYSHSLE
jgi:hypothetical protein